MDKAISAAVRTGKVLFGANSAVQNAQTGKAVLIVLADNCPEGLRRDVEYYAKLSGTPVLIFKGTGLDLASVCSKSFSVSALSIREAGDSEIMSLVRQTEPEEQVGGNE